jgi:hypothetical protein
MYFTHVKAFRRNESRGLFRFKHEAPRKKLEGGGEGNLKMVSTLHLKKKRIELVFYL